LFLKTGTHYQKGMMNSDLAKAERKWRKRPLFRKQQSALGLLVGSGLLLVLIGFGIFVFFGGSALS